jgi:hypothetical protein
VKLPPAGWLSFEMTAGLGEAMNGQWSLRVSAPDWEQSWGKRPVADARFRAFDWLGFVSNARVKTSAFLDDLSIVPNLDRDDPPAAHGTGRSH